jgi:hypothetical protein
MTRMLRQLLFALTLATPLSAQQPQAPPSPSAVLGHTVGESGWLAEWSEILAYFERLDEATPLIAVERIGESVEGRPMIMAVITSAANHARIEEIRSAQARLADPRNLAAAELERLVDTQPAVALIGASLHGNEIMATQMSMELAHTLVTDPAHVRALDDVVVLLVPGMNPDGLDITRDWWLRTRGTRFAGSPMPWLYHHYTGHDNNRDFFMVTQPETRAITRVLYERWFPEVVYDVHQMGNGGARFFVPPFGDPLNPNLDPLLVRQTNLVGVQMALDLTAAGKAGVVHAERYDLWWHGGARTVPARHNMVGILTEAASADYGDPIDQRPEELEQPEPGSLYPEPWPGGEWRPRDIVEYELIAAASLVRLLSRQRGEFVRNYATLARRQVEQGAAGDPFAYIIPAEQRDPGSAAELLRVLRRGGVEIHRATAPFFAEGRVHPAGSHVILMAQPYRAHAKDLLEAQLYPDMRLYPDGPPIAPYDLSGWTLALQMGVAMETALDPFPLNQLVRTDTIVTPAGRTGGRGGAVALDPRLNATHRAVHEVLALPEAGRVTITELPVEVDGEQWPEGTFIVSGVPGLAERASRWAREWGVNAVAIPEVPAGQTLRQLRVALYRSWAASADEGWTRWVFEQWGVPFDSLRDRQVRAGGLRERFDAIVIPDHSYRELMRGLDPARSPPEHAGGLGEEGARALRDFVQAGGTLILLDTSSELAIRELGVPVREVTATLDGAETDRWYAPGSLLRVRWDTAHPVAAGMPEESAVFYARGPVFEARPGASGVSVVGRFPGEELLLSGYAQGEAQVAGGAALVEARLGQGRVVMFGFRPQHRAQTHETFKLLFNALYLQ